MNTPHDGGPAFPYERQIRCHGEIIDREVIPGMSRRDWFAGQALAGLMVNYNEHPHSVKDCAVIAADAADAVLERISAREKANQ